MSICVTFLLQLLTSYKASLSKLHYPCQTLFQGWCGDGQVWFQINLTELIEQKRISKNKLCQRAEMQRTQLNSFCNNTITRLDVDVLARLCTVLECEIGDLLTFVPPSENAPEHENK